MCNEVTGFLPSTQQIPFCMAKLRRRQEIKKPPSKANSIPVGGFQPSQRVNLASEQHVEDQPVPRLFASNHRGESIPQALIKAIFFFQSWAQSLSKPVLPPPPPAVGWAGNFTQAKRILYVMMSCLQQVLKVLTMSVPYA